MIIILLHWNLPGEKVGFIPEMGKREEALYETPTEAAANYEIPVASATVSIIVYLMLTILVLYIVWCKSNAHHLWPISFCAHSFQTIPSWDFTYLLR